MGAILEHFAAAGIVFDALAGGRIVAHGELSDELRAAIREAKLAIVAELAAAGEARRFRWQITLPGRDSFEARCVPERTAAEMLALYSGATCEPPPDVEAGDADPGEPKASLAADDRRTCEACRNLATTRDAAGFRRCRAAARGELHDIASRRYAPVPDLPRRCCSFLPLPGDDDQRPGRERWPGVGR